MKIREALQFASKKLYKSSTANLDARLLLAFATNSTHEQLLLNYDKEISQSLKAKFMQLVNRRQSMEPIAYIVGYQEFYGLEFIVDKNVLIPRPDTELLIDLILNYYNKYNKNKNISILELGTGSGAIAITLANQITKSTITAVDISSSALEIAKQNSEKHNVVNQIFFKKSNWYQNLRSKQYDYIVSNPPYIAKEEKHQMAYETMHFEPDIALYSTDNGLADYKKILSEAKQYLKPNGKLLLEIGYKQKPFLSNLLQEYDFTKLNTYSDLANHDRVIVASQ